jgi:hypothetical protein
MTAAERKARQRERERRKEDERYYAMFPLAQSRPPAAPSVPVTQQFNDSVTASAPSVTALGFDRQKQLLLLERLSCCICGKTWSEVEHMLIIAGRKGRDVVAVCNDCSEPSDAPEEEVEGDAE